MNDPMPPGLAEFDNPELSVLIRTLWNHVRAARTRTGDSRDTVSLPSLDNTLKANRQALERLWGEQNARDRRVMAFYGDKWFKCCRLDGLAFVDLCAAEERSRRKGQGAKVPMSKAWLQRDVSNESRLSGSLGESHAGNLAQVFRFQLTTAWAGKLAVNVG